MRSVVTGAAGFIGSSISERLLRDGHEVVGIDCFTDYYPRDMKSANLQRALSHDSYSFVEGDLLEIDLQKVCEGAEVIFHQAAQAGVRKSWGDDFSIYTDNNILATQRLLEAAKNPPLSGTLKQFVNASSSSVYGHAENFPTLETTLPRPVSPYGVSKLAAEKLAVLYAAEFGVPTVSLRYFTVYGPRQRPDMAFHKVIKAALTGQVFQVFGDGEQSRDFTFIDDAVEANLAAANCSEPGAVCNIGGGSRVTLNEVLKQIEAIIGIPLQLEYVDRQKGDARHTSASVAEAERLFGYAPSVDLEQGLRAEVAWLEELIKSN